jgi:hypothetical protein
LFPVKPKRGPIDLKIAAGSEKMEWFTHAKNMFLADPKLNTVDGRQIRIIIDKVGSIESGRAIARGETVHNGRNDYQVWSPASSAFRSIVEDRFEGRLFETDDSVARSPMVFMTWQPVQNAVDSQIQKTMSFDTITEIFGRELDNTIIDPSGRSFQFAFTKPWKSNSGAVALITMAYEYFASSKPRYKIRMRDLENDGFQKYLAFIKTLSLVEKTSTGKLVSPMISGGYGGQEVSSAYLYENLAIKAAFLSKSTAKPVICYPKYNLVSDHPYYAIRHGNSKAQMTAARRFLDFLLSRQMQQYALQREGFRPVSAEITNEEMNQVLGHFVENNGVIPDLLKASQILIPPQKGDVLDALIDLFMDLEDAEGTNF